jgi:hypothetical protein
MWRTEARPSHTDPGCTSIDELRDSQSSSSSLRTRHTHAPPTYGSSCPTNAHCSHHREKKTTKTIPLPSCSALSRDIGSGTRRCAAHLARLKEPQARGRMSCMCVSRRRREGDVPLPRPAPDADAHRFWDVERETARLVCLCLYSPSRARDTMASLVRRRSPPRHHCARSEDEDELRALSASRSGPEPSLICSSLVLSSARIPYISHLRSYLRGERASTSNVYC